jgi:hypothetical protein
MLAFQAEFLRKPSHSNIMRFVHIDILVIHTKPSLPTLYSIFAPIQYSCFLYNCFTSQCSILSIPKNRQRWRFGQTFVPFWWCLIIIPLALVQSLQPFLPSINVICEVNQNDRVSDICHNWPVYYCLSSLSWENTWTICEMSSQIWRILKVKAIFNIWTCRQQCQAVM